MKTHPSTYRTAEGQEKIRPTYVYIVTHGSNLYHFTNSDTTISLTDLPASKGTDPQTITSAQVSHSAVKQDSEINAPQIQMNVGVNSSAFASALKSYILQSVPDPITVVIARINPEAISKDGGATVDWTADAYVIFKGVVTNIAFNQYVMQLNLISLIMQNEGSIPRYYWQKTCQHMLYGTQCGVTADQAAFRITTTAAAVDSRWRSVDITETTLDGSLIDEKTFQSGLLYELDGSSNIIARIRIDWTLVLPASAGVRFYLGWWSNTLAAATNIKVFRGCDRTAKQCGEVFANKANFGGMAYIPNINPTINGIRS
jgi:hypothetical protein